MSFESDDRWQRLVRDSLLMPAFYDRYAVNGRYVFVDKGELAIVLQRRYAVDTIVQGRDGKAICVEEKIVRWPGYDYSSVCLETNSCTLAGRETPGWMEYGQADLLLYAMMKPDRLEVHTWNFQELKRWFWPRAETFPTFRMNDTRNHSLGRVVPMDAINAAVQHWHRTIWPDPSAAYFAELFPNASPTLDLTDLSSWPEDLRLLYDAYPSRDAAKRLAFIQRCAANKGVKT